MAGKSWNELNNATEDEILNYFFEQLTPEILVELLKQKIDIGQANVGEVLRKFVDDQETAIVIMKRY